MADTSSGYFDLLAFDGTYSSNISFYCVPHEQLSLARKWYTEKDTELNCLIPPYSTVMNVWYYPYLFSKFKLSIVLTPFLYDLETFLILIKTLHLFSIVFISITYFIQFF